MKGQWRGRDPELVSSLYYCFRLLWRQYQTVWQRVTFTTGCCELKELSLYTDQASGLYGWGSIPAWSRYISLCLSIKTLSGAQPTGVKWPGDRAAAQAVSCWLLTAEARVRCQGSLCGICGWQSGTETEIFLRVLRFALLVSFHRCCNSLMYRLGLDNGPVSGRSSTET
jgi:hypothetical protein